MLAQRLNTCNADVFYGEAKFQDPHLIRLRPIDPSQARDEHKKQVASTDGEILLRGEQMIATGSSPVRPSLFPFGPGVYDSDTLLELENVPGTLAVIGAGPLAASMPARLPRSAPRCI